MGLFYRWRHPIASGMAAKHFLHSNWQNWLSQLVIDGRCWR